MKNDKIVGVVVNNMNGKSAETSVFKIHYAKKEFHIVLDYPSKKEAVMKYEIIEKFIDKKVILTDIDGKMFRGVITNTESEFDTLSGKPEVELYTGKIYIGIPFDEIENIIEIE